MNIAPEVEIANVVWPWIEANKTLVTSLTAVTATAMTLVGGWIVGAALTAKWNLRVKEREADISAILRVRELYGTLLSLRRRWDDHLKRKHSEGWATRTLELLDKASDAEGELEGIILKVSGERKLSENEVDQLGFVRQAYQQARECIRAEKAIPWDSSEQCQYQVLKLGTQALIAILYRPRIRLGAVPPGQFSKISRNNPFEALEDEADLVRLIKERRVFSEWVDSPAVYSITHVEEEARRLA